ncbi:hypothetical protein KIH23_11730 [Flavobacterium sp. CYK-55]|uniref:hypothetical protein n=1 Tax=Flavobacterium sp. CYK-55 TaxID=2835529 RepID=UPI001BCCBCAD|nr:hypothetical protein [Flavobacterium sp. CYK-55]MBS7787967.1 hypothetical protein [Flavobacterium sp. CYK-55]
MPHTTKLYIVQAHCWRCRQPAALAMIKSPNTFYGPEGFNPQQTLLATRQGAVILPQYSRYAQTTYPANSCGHCKAFLGEHYLFTEYFISALDGHYPYQTVVVDVVKAPEK